VAVQYQHMNASNTPAILRSLIIYAICIPLAIWIGFMLANPFDRATFSYAGILALLLLAPIILRWHHLLLIVCWNLDMTIFFLPGRPPVWLLMVALSLGLSVLHRTINDKVRFLSAPSITWPLLFFLAVVLMTAKLRGGIGLNSLGNDTAGGRSYVFLIMGILGYFALTAQRIPPKRVKLYVGLFYLAGFSAAVGDLAPYVPRQLYFLFAFFPVSGYNMEFTPGVVDFNARYTGMSILGMSGFLFMLACYGVRGIFLTGKLWRPVLLGLFSIAILLGGFRSHIIICGATFLIQCYMERIHRTKIFPVFLLAGMIGVTLLIPFASKLPFTFQRSLAFLPLTLNHEARLNADESRDWRLQIWKDALPTVPQYLLLGRGYAISKHDLDVANDQAFHYASNFEAVDIAGNYHSGPLSVIIYFGIWGVMALLWFWIASLRALYLNYQNGDAEMRVMNTFLLAYFAVKVFHFLIIFGSLYSDMADFTALIGLSVCLNDGIRRPAPAPARVVDKHSDLPLARPRFQPFYPR
jgi:hypothetical protein